jgi:hypothetical protein
MDILLAAAMIVLGSVLTLAAGALWWVWNEARKDRRRAARMADFELIRGRRFAHIERALAEKRHRQSAS